jgi:hypothetical protein
VYRIRQCRREKQDQKGELPYGISPQRERWGRPFSFPHPQKRKGCRRANVIQIRMTERELELKYVPVSFFVKKTEKKG